MHRVSALLFAALLASAEDSSQSSGPEPVRTTVTVTGTRGPMELDKSPVSSSLVTRQEMETRNVRQIDQALTLTEGVIAIRTRGPADNDFGLGLRGFAGRGGQSRTLILVDGQPVNNSYIGSVNWSTFSVSEMDRVEVARGPFSSPYGGNAMGGVVNMITRPVDRRHAELFGQFGSFDTTNYSLRVADRFFDRLGASFGYSRFQTGGYQAQETLRPVSTTASGGIPVIGMRRWLTPTGGTTYQVGHRGRNWFNQEAFRGRGEMSFTPKVFATLQYMHQTRDDGWDAYTTLLRDVAGRPVDNGLVSFVEDGVTRHLTLAPNNFIGTPTGAVLHIVQAQVLATLSPVWNLCLASGITRSPADWYVTTGANATLVGGGGSYVTQANQGVYGNVQLTHQTSGQTITTGTETRHDRASLTSQNVASYALRQDPGRTESQGFGKALNQAAYVQYQKLFSDEITVVAGGRWDYWRTYDGGTQTSPTEPIQRFGDRTTNSLTGKVAASWRLPSNWQVRGSVGNAFRNPSVYELYRDLTLSGILYLANPNVQPEKLFAWEAGLQRFFAAGHAVEATYFENRVSDLIYRTTDFAADSTGRLRRLTNAGLSRTRGLELSSRQRIKSWLGMRQFYTWNDPVLLENPSLPETVGRTLPYVPRHTLGYLATASRHRWTATWGGRYVGKYFSTDTNADTTRGVPGSYNPFFEMEATLSIELHRRASLLINADNLLDRRYYGFALSPGRAIYVGLRLRW